MSIKFELELDFDELPDEAQKEIAKEIFSDSTFELCTNGEAG